MNSTKEHIKYLKKIRNEKILIISIQFLIIITFLIIWQLLSDYNITNTQYVPDNFGGSSSSSSAVNPSLMATSFPQRDIDELMNMSMSLGYSFDR